MKRIFYSFLLIFLLSCGHTKPPMINHVIVTITDPAKIQAANIDYFLLAVHDSSIIVAPFIEDENLQLGTLVGSAIAIPFSRITEVYYKDRAKTSDEILGGLVGCATFGTTAGCMAYAQSFGDGGGVKSVVPYYLSPFVGFALGVLISDLTAREDDHYFTDTKERVDALRRRAYYSKQEPQQLLLLK